MAQETFKALQKLKVDCLYKKGTHFIAARRLETESNRFKWILIAGTLVASFSTIMNVGVWDKIVGETFWIEILVNVLGALGGFLMLYATAFNDHWNKLEQANKNELIGTDFNLIFKRIRNTEAQYIDHLISDQQLVEKLNELTEEFINKCSTAPKTTDEDYFKFRDQVKKGYATDYTEKELKS